MSNFSKWTALPPGDCIIADTRLSSGIWMYEVRLPYSELPVRTALNDPPDMMR